ncbi:MAG: hypothetical protein AAF438_02640 [Pseudomonadota bacterium]
MRLIQICVDGLDDLVSFAGAINNWPALMASGFLTLCMLVATYLIAPWVFAVAAGLGAAAAGVWVCILVCYSLPSVRQRALGCYSMAMLSSALGIFLFFTPDAFPGQVGLMLVAAAGSLVSAFLAHELTRELSLQARSQSVYKFK